jgi:hypothetical protein
MPVSFLQYTNSQPWLTGMVPLSLPASGASICTLAKISMSFRLPPTSILATLRYSCYALSAPSTPPCSSKGLELGVVMGYVNGVLRFGISELSGRMLTMITELNVPPATTKIATSVVWRSSLLVDFATFSILPLPRH